MKKQLFLCLLLVGESLMAMPSQILMIRHAEKPVSGNELSPKGWERAKLLPSLFERIEFKKFGMPTALYAMTPSKPGGSVRAIQTLRYVSEKLVLKINSDFTRDQVIEMVSEIKNERTYDGKMIVICWEHKVLLDLAKALGVKEPLDWPSQQFDRVWSLTYGIDNTVKFENLPERLVPGDSLN